MNDNGLTSLLYFLAFGFLFYGHRVLEQRFPRNDVRAIFDSKDQHE